MTPLFSGPRPMRVAALMSGSGSNLIKLLDTPSHGPSYQIACILTDNPASNARAIAQKYGIPYEENDIAAFYRQRGLKRSDLGVRPAFDRISVQKLEKYRPDVLAYCGYMSLASPVLVNAFLGVNVHPADLRIRDKNGRRRFVGAHAVRDALLAGEKKLRSTTHLVSAQTDQGAILMVSAAVPVRLPDAFDPKKAGADALDAVVRGNQQRLKEKGDWIVLPKTLDAIADGRFSQDANGRIYFDGKDAPEGVELRMK